MRNAVADISNLLERGEAQVIKMSWKERILRGRLDGKTVDIYYDMYPQYLVIKYGIFKEPVGGNYRVEYGNVELPKDDWIGENLIH